MHRFVVLICICLCSSGAWAGDKVAGNNVAEGMRADSNGDDDSFAGIYRVTRASLNEDQCEKEGGPTEYASRFLRVDALGEDGYRASVCNGDALDELECSSGYHSTKMTEALKNGWQGYSYLARPGVAIDNTPRCALYAARRKVVEMGSGQIRYERTDWSETLADFSAECDRDMARLYSESQSLKCASHIVIFAEKID